MFLPSIQIFYPPPHQILCVRVFWLPLQMVTNSCNFFGFLCNVLLRRPRLFWELFSCSSTVIPFQAIPVPSPPQPQENGLLLFSIRPCFFLPDRFFFLTTLFFGPPPTIFVFPFSVPSLPLRLWGRHSAEVFIVSAFWFPKTTSLTDLPHGPSPPPLMLHGGGYSFRLPPPCNRDNRFLMFNFFSAFVPLSAAGAGFLFPFLSILPVVFRVAL